MEQELEKNKIGNNSRFSDKNYYFTMKFCDATPPNWKSFKFFLVCRMCETHSFYQKSLNYKYAFGLVKVWVWKCSGKGDMRGLRRKLYFRNVVCCFLQLVSTDRARVDLLRKAGSRLFPEKQQEKEETEQWKVVLLFEECLITVSSEENQVARVSQR